MVCFMVLVAQRKEKITQGQGYPLGNLILAIRPATIARRCSRAEISLYLSHSHTCYDHSEQCLTLYTAEAISCTFQLSEWLAGAGHSNFRKWLGLHFMDYRRPNGIEPVVSCEHWSLWFDCGRY